MSATSDDQIAGRRGPETLRAMRQQGDWIEVPFVTLVRGGRSIRLFGVCHYSPAPFWGRLNSEVASLADSGWAIHLEGVEGEGGGLSGKAVRYIQRAGREIFGNLIPNLLYQRTHFHHPEGARTVDLTAAEVLGGMNAPARASMLVEAGGSWVLSAATSHMEPEVMEDGFWKMAGSGKRSWATRLTDPVIIDLRNVHATQHALIEAEQRDVALVWGAAHIPGMTDLLMEDGWVVVDVEWVPWRQFPGKGSCGSDCTSEH